MDLPPPIRSDRLLERDDRRLVEPLRHLRGLSDYADAVRSGRILDLQPVRDLSFALDLAIGSATGLGTFHLTNLLLWLAITAVVYRILRQNLGPGPLAVACVAVFALHPVFVNSVGWVAARKHLLSSLFILFATYEVLRADRILDGRRTGWIGLLFGLSILSQPITVLWPLWAVSYLWLRGPGHRMGALRLVGVCAPLLGACVAANLFYYQGAFVQQTGAQKFVEVDGTGAVALLALGRYFANLAFPVSLATSYCRGARSTSSDCWRWWCSSLRR